MGLFVRKLNQHSEPANYSISGAQTILIVGLGNPGKQYVKTRHNVGFACLDAFAKNQSFPDWLDKKSFRAHITHRTIGSTRVILVKPQTFMNASGEAVHAVQQFYKIRNAVTAVVHDELDLPFGTIRTKQGGGSAGHNGLKSIISQCGEDFGRIRFGVSNAFSEQADSADFVLGRFTAEEQTELPALIDAVTNLLDTFAATGVLPEKT